VGNDTDNGGIFSLRQTMDRSAIRAINNKRRVRRNDPRSVEDIPMGIAVLKMDLAVPFE